MATKTVTGRNRLIKYRIQSYIYLVTITIKVYISNRTGRWIFRSNSYVSELEMTAKVFFSRWIIIFFYIIDKEQAQDEIYAWILLIHGHNEGQVSLLS